MNFALVLFQMVCTQKLSIEININHYGVLVDGTAETIQVYKKRDVLQISNCQHFLGVMMLTKHLSLQTPENAAVNDEREATLTVIFVVECTDGINGVVPIQQLRVASSCTREWLKSLNATVCTFRFYVL